MLQCRNFSAGTNLATLLQYRLNRLWASARGFRLEAWQEINITDKRIWNLVQDNTILLKQAYDTKREFSATDPKDLDKKPAPFSKFRTWSCCLTKSTSMRSLKTIDETLPFSSSMPTPAKLSCVTRMSGWKRLSWNMTEGFTPASSHDPNIIGGNNSPFPPAPTLGN